MVTQEGMQGDALWRSLVEALPDVVFVLNSSCEVAFANDKAPPLARGPVVGKKVRDCLNAPAANVIQRVVDRAINSRIVARDELYDEGAGNARWYEVAAVPLAVGSGQQVLVTLRDVTDRRTAVETLEASERKFRALVEHGNDCIVLIDSTERITYASPALLRSLGYMTEELVGMDANMFVHPEDIPNVDDARVAQPGESVLGAVRLRHKNGTWRVHEGMARNLLHDPAVRAYVCNRRDVTERRLEEGRQAFQAALLAQVSQPIVAIDSNGLFVYWNAAAERVFGWSEREVLGRHTEDMLGASWPEPTGYDWHGEMQLATKWGTHIVVEASMRRHDANVIAVMQDVTDRRHLENQLRQSQKMEAIGLLAGGVAHDFNNLLAVILGFSEMAKRRLEPSDLVHQQVSEILDAAKRGIDLTRKLLAFSRKQIIQLRAIDLAVSIDDFSRLLERIVGEDVELVVEQEERDAVFVNADAAQLEQVLLNLCTNARQAMPSGGTLRLSTRRVSFDEAFARRNPRSRPGAFAEVAVSDTGIGMDEATRQRLFEPFFTTKPDGTGLGLATVYGIVERHGGFIDVESQVGHGTTFRVYLPLSEPDASVDDRSRRSSDMPVAGAELVLVAEDERAVRTLIASTLRELGYLVIAAADGEEAVRIYERRAPDIALVVMDVVMPRLDARGAYERMRAIRKDVRVVFTTGYAPESTRIGELLEAPHTRLLEKPFTAKQLAQAVRTAIDA